MRAKQKRKINVLCGYDEKDRSRDAMIYSSDYKICSNEWCEVILSKEECLQLVKDIQDNIEYCERISNDSDNEKELLWNYDG